MILAELDGAILILQWAGHEFGYWRYRPNALARLLRATVINSFGHLVCLLHYESTIDLNLFGHRLVVATESERRRGRRHPWPSVLGWVLQKLSI